MIENEFLYVLYPIIGLLVGAYGSLIGAGGGFLIVPLLLYQNLSPQQAIGTSLAIVFLNGLSGTMSYARQHRIDYHAGLRFAVWVAPGAIGGVYISSLFTLQTFSAAFGFLLIIIASFLVFRPLAVREQEATSSSANGPLENQAAVPKAQEPEVAQRDRLLWWNHRTVRSFSDADGRAHSYEYHTLGSYILSFFIGFFSSLFGIGGGIIRVPAMIHLLNFPVHIATATSLFILTISVGLSAIVHALLGNILFLTTIALGVGAIIGAPLGARLARRIHGAWLVRLLSLGLFAIGFRLLLL